MIGRTGTSSDGEEVEEIMKNDFSYYTQYVKTCPDDTWVF